MQKLTPAGQNLVADLSSRYGFSQDAVTHMLIAVLNGNGSMAQFNHPEFAGGGQWMQGGMLMLGDMFNHGLKGSVDSLCNEISNVLASQPGLLQTGSFQSQSQGGASQQSQSTGGHSSGSSLFVPDPEQNWWPQELGSPSSLGSQNNVRYAYFASAGRLAVKTGGDVWLYDTLDHQIGGFSQQQGGGSSITFTSQYGTVNLSTLPVVSQNGQPVPPPVSTPEPQPLAAPVQQPIQPEPESPVAAESPNQADIIDSIARLGELNDKGVLTDEEFLSKKAELLSRI